MDLKKIKGLKFYKISAERTVELLESDIKKGLSNIEAERRLQRLGENRLSTDIKISRIKLFISQFNDFITYILLAACIISFLFGLFYDKEHFVDALIILVILIANALIGFFQELSAQQSLESLRKLNLIEVKTIRDGKTILIDSTRLVVGDIVILEAGDKIPADCRIIEEKRLKVDESAITGENLSVKKNSQIIEKEVQLGDQKNLLFSGTNVINGTVKAIVIKTGMNTEIGKITSMIKETKEEMTPLQKRLDRFGKRLGMVIIGICILIFISLILKNGFSITNIIDFSLVSISLAVAAVPTALPAVVTIALAIGVKRLLKKRALVRRLSSVETLGSCNIICTDKTGTLTKNEMTVKYLWSYGKEATISGIGYSPRGIIEGRYNKLLLTVGAVCNNATLVKKDNVWCIIGDSTEGALLVSAKKANLDTENYTRIDELPFDSTRKMMSVLTRKKNGKEKGIYYQFSKGSPHSILKSCRYILINGKKERLTKEHIKEVENKINEYSKQALRTLGFAYKEIKNRKDFTESNLIFVGIQAMQDPPREDVIKSIEKCHNAGIDIIMITGDYKETAKAIGKEVGIKGEVMTGEELENFSDEELKERIKNGTKIFARVIPEHKQRIIKILQEEGNVVAMTGDGINDAPALKKADIGVAIGNGTDVAKEASDFILLDNGFTNIVNAIEEGRGISQNIQKSIMLLLSGNFGEVMIITLSVLLDFNLPLTAILLLWINLITDGAPALAFSIDSHGRDIMKQPPNRDKYILSTKRMLLIGYLGFAGSVIGLHLFRITGGNLGDKASLYSQTMIFNFIVLYEILLVFIIRRDFNVKQFSNIWLWASVLLSVFLQGIIMYTPLSKIFRVVPLNLVDIGMILYAGFIFVLFYFIIYYFYLSKIYIKKKFKLIKRKNNLIY